MRTPLQNYPRRSGTFCSTPWRPRLELLPEISTIGLAARVQLKVLHKSAVRLRQLRVVGQGLVQRERSSDCSHVRLPSLFPVGTHARTVPRHYRMGSSGEASKASTAMLHSKKAPGRRPLSPSSPWILVGSRVVYPS